jgi:hypothetical protein
MSHLLLLGAGFSRNWGGWLAAEAFEYLLGCPEVRASEEIRKLLWRHQSKGGFENALAELQKVTRDDPGKHGPRLRALQDAVSRMFADMNQGFYDLVDIEFQQYRATQLRPFLARFDAIFTLNQDVLLEHHYLSPPENLALVSNRQWNGPQLPGMKLVVAASGYPTPSWAQRAWVPSNDHRVSPGMQPFFKLHGSSNWQTTEGHPMLIMGGDKVREIGLHPILAWYADQFDHYLAQPNSRLMVIGYGFRDEHINAAIRRAVERNGLQLFVIAPHGGELARALNPTNSPGLIRKDTELECAFERSLIGASRRSLSEIFGRDAIEHKKVQRFFEF